MEKDLPFSLPSLNEQPSRGERFRVLVVEDNKADVFLVREAVEMYGLEVELGVVEDGKAATSFIDRADGDPAIPGPSLFLIDLNIPLKTGREVLAHLRQSKRFSQSPVLIMTSSNSPRDRADVEKLGANVYFRKPLSYDLFLKIGEEIRRLLAEQRMH